MTINKARAVLIGIAAAILTPYLAAGAFAIHTLIR